MIRFRHVAAALLALSVLMGCGSDSGEPADPPAGGLTAVPGDGTVVVSWTDDPNVDFWLFVSTDSRMTINNFSTLTDVRVIRNARSAYVLCGYPNGRTLYLMMNGRTNSGPGGDATPTINTTLRPAGSAWTPGTAPASDFNGVGYAPLTTCFPTALPTGIFVAVGPNAGIASSTDGVNFTARTPPAGFTTDLNAVATFNTSINVLGGTGLKIVAVGAGGASLVSTDGVTWTAGAAFNPAAPTLRSVAVHAGVFIAVGDGGVAQTTTDGITWTTRASNSTLTLQAIRSSGERCIAVGDNGTIVRTVDQGVTWDLIPISGTPALKDVVYGNFNNNVGSPTTALNTWVAVGDAGTVLYSLDGGTTWNATTVPGAADFVAVSYLTRFIAIDSAGNSFSSIDGQNWTGPVATGLTTPRSAIGNGVGFVVVGAGGGTASSF
jgi:photosystem II stability/assembly factor-like uncharacterized protein